MSVHKEVVFENEVCAHLAANGWLYAEGDAAQYDKVRALFPADIVAWVQAAHPQAWATLTKNHGTKATETLLSRLRDQLDQRGTLEVLRHGIDLLGLKGPLKLAQFKPAFGLNPDILARYGANRLRVVRQVRYSLHNENCLDLVLFLNGVPVATVELKSDYTQSADDAVAQYREDRLPHPKGQGPEPLLSFLRGALVHFAVSNSDVQMTTRLEGRETLFLPFNRGNEGGKGNPLNPHGHRTAYLWEQVWERESWLEIVGRYLVAQRERGKLSKVVFPRYHQLDVTRKLQAAVLKDGAGTKYLVQHSAGSGKTNSIAWTAHFLSELHDAHDRRVFDTVLVVSDRAVIDAQLRETLEGFQRTQGVVASISDNAPSKSGALTEALSEGKRIVVCTMQTFPHALEAAQRLAGAEGKRFAVIADEAHSSQSGETAKQLRQLLSVDELKALDDGGEVSTEDLLAARMAGRADDRGLTFVAFTATPKNKTLELFGTRPDPTRKPAEDNVPKPFHVYSMRQAIEEEFILDVLQNYTPYELAFKLAQAGQELDPSEVERGTALKKVMRWVALHPYNISQKVQVVVEHFRTYVAPLLGGRAKAMVVTASRLEAVRWKLAVEKYVAAQGYGIGTLVAFSGEVDDKESGPEPFTETSPTMNPKLKGRDIREAFKGAEYQLLLVANKFQTGFDQPLLCGMYVDRKLAGIQAVQTLSRLNRAHTGKDTTYVVDFQNDPQDVLEAFKTYYETAELSATTDPHLVYDLYQKLDGAGLYDTSEVERVVKASLGGNQAALDIAVSPVAGRIQIRFKNARDAHRFASERGDEAAAKEAKAAMEAVVLFRTDMMTFQRLYTFLSQVFDYGNTELEKRAIFFKHLLQVLKLERERTDVDVSGLKLTHHTLRSQGKAAMALREGVVPKLEPLTAAGSGAVQEKQRAQLREIIEKVNALFEGALSDQDKLVYVNDVLKGKLLENETLAQQAANNTKEQFATSPDLQSGLTNAIMEALDAHAAMSTQALGSKAVQAGLLDVLLNHAGLWEALKQKAAG